MKVAAGEEFIARFGASAKEIVPELAWATIDGDGRWDGDPTDAEIIVYAADAYTSHFVDTVTSRLPSIRWAHTEDAGTDGFFYDSMREKGVVVTHSPGANAPEVAEFAMACVLQSAKRLNDLRDAQRAHIWQRLPLESLSDKTALIVGLGAIGGRIAKFAKAFDMHVIGLRRSAEPVACVDDIATLDQLHEMLPKADFVILALPLSPATENMIDAAALALMKPTATIVNVARGGLIDITALKAALANDKLRQVCLDVLPEEPWPGDDELWDLDNVVITPHTAASSGLYAPRVGAVWLENLRRRTAGEEMLHRAF